MPYFLSDFIKEHEGIELNMDVTNKTKVLENLENNEIDFALVSLLPTNINIEKLDLMQNKLYLVGNTSIQIKKNQKLTELFERSSLIFREKGSGIDK